MKHTIISMFIILVLAFSATALTMVREIPSGTVAPGAQFTVKYRIIDAVGNYGVLIEDNVAGGCTPEHLATGFLSPSTYSDIVYTAPSTGGSCVFTGNYQFASNPQTPSVDFNSQAVIIANPECTASSQCTASCKVGTCSSGKCSYTNAADGTGCSGGYCNSGICTASTPSSDVEIPVWIWFVVGFFALLIIMSIIKRN